MPISIGLWRVDEGIRRLSAGGMPTEERLEDLIETDPDVLGQPLLIIGRQVVTSYGKRADLLAIDADGALHVLELKRNKTPRDVIAQALDYGSWAQSLSHEQVLGIYASHHPDRAIEVAFTETFGIPLPDELNTGHWLTIVAADIDPESQRIVEYLDSFGIPVNVVFFRYFIDGDREYVARTWLIDEVQEAGPRTQRSARAREQWNGRDWYISFGEEPGGRSWEDARALGFVSAGGGDWYSRSLAQVPEGARIWVCIPTAGYVGVGTTTGISRPFRETELDTDELQGSYVHDGGDEWVIPVRWDRTRPRSEAFWEKGMFANQNSACRLRDQFTIDRIYPAFGMSEDA